MVEGHLALRSVAVSFARCWSTLSLCIRSDVLCNVCVCIWFTIGITGRTWGELCGAQRHGAARARKLTHQHSALLVLGGRAACGRGAISPLTSPTVFARIQNGQSPLFGFQPGYVPFWAFRAGTLGRARPSSGRWVEPECVSGLSHLAPTPQACKGLHAHGVRGGASPSKSVGAPAFGIRGGHVRGDDLAPRPHRLAHLRQVAGGL